MTPEIVLPPEVHRKVQGLGPRGQQWLADLPGVVEALASTWAIVIGASRGGGSGGYVADVRLADGTPAVLKVAIPDGLEGHPPFARELETLRAAAGRGYVRVLRADEAARAMLLERLGRPLSGLGLPVEAQVDAVAETLGRAWRQPPEALQLPTGAEQAAFLAGFIRRTWEELHEPCPRDVVDEAVRFASSRRAAFDPAAAVLIHADAHPDNILEDPDGPSGSFRLIDPEGLLSEPAHDLAICLRDWTGELLAGDPRSLGLEWCRRLGDRAGVPAGPIWEWAFIERVSTGLFLCRLGDPLGPGFLDVARQWAGGTSTR